MVARLEPLSALRSFSLSFASSSSLGLVAVDDLDDDLLLCFFLLLLPSASASAVLLERDERDFLILVPSEPPLAAVSPAAATPSPSPSVLDAAES